MGKKDPRVDAHIAKAADFAKPILRHIRAVIHEGCPDVTEEIKWGMPFFMYHGTFAQLAAFKHHVVFGFWNKAMIVETRGEDGSAKKWVNRFNRITSMDDLPSKATLLKQVKTAARLNDGRTPAPRTAPRPKKKAALVRTPAVLLKALAKNTAARETFDGFAPSHRKEYVQWITEAKTDETRDRRVAQAVEWMAVGKARNWKYMRR